MVRVLVFAIALALFPAVSSAQDDPLAWFPLQVGNRWLYEHEWKSGDQRRPTVERWITEESVVGSVTIPEGVVVLREVKRQSTAPEQPTRILGLDGRVHELQHDLDGGYVVTRQREPYLVRGSCVYVIDDGFDEQTQQLRPTYRKYLAEGVLSPDFCFPPEMGRRWGNADIPWRVEPASSGALVQHVGGVDWARTFLAPQYANATHVLSDHFGSSGRMDVWFQKGIGVVAEHYYHNGSYDEYTKKLVSFSH
jgi:hypothetical protein